MVQLLLTSVKLQQCNNTIFGDIKYSGFVEVTTCISCNILVKMLMVCRVWWRLRELHCVIMRWHGQMQCIHWQYPCLVTILTIKCKGWLDQLDTETTSWLLHTLMKLEEWTENNQSNKTNYVVRNMKLFFKRFQQKVSDLIF